MSFDLSEYETLLVVGIDEAGRGPLAGPVVAAGVVLDRHHPIAGLNDSKKLREKAREELFLQINEHALAVAICEVDSRNIDRINILRATLLAMKNVVLEISEKMSLDWALIDGNIMIPGELPLKQRAIIKGDSLVPSIMAASIVAKVHRDRLMKDYDKIYPGYGFDAHKGYGTAMHMNALAKLGPCPIHRLSYEPLRSPSLL